MPSYEYHAINPQGKKVKGSVDADNIRTARQKLRVQGIFATDIKEGMEMTKEKSKDVKRYLQFNWVGLKDLSVMTRQLATLVGAGLPLVGALMALSDQVDSVTLKRIIINVREKVEEGSALAKAMGDFPKAFPRLYINMIAAGEASGTLDAALENLADYLEAQLELRRKITTALFYPILMLGFCGLVIVALLAFVVPNIVDIFTKQGSVLPLPTRILIGVSDFLTGYWYLMIAAGILLVMGVRRYYGTEKGRKRIDFIMLRLPIYGSIYRKIATARVAGTLATLLGSGVGLLTALDIVRNIVSNVHIAKALEDSRDGVREGRSLAKELSKSGMFPSILCHMIAVGEASGRLEGMLDKAGKSYQNEVNATLAGLASLIEPLMIIGLGGIVFSIVISILLPMVDLINVVQK